METRILIPKGLKIIFVNSCTNTSGLNDNGENFSAKVKGGGSSYKTTGGTGKEKPTSSSGCDAEDSDSDSDFNATEAVDTSGEEDTDCEGLKISKIWNPSYNLRRSRSQQGSGDEKRVKEEKVLRGNGDFDVVVANADSNVPTDNSGHSEGKVGNFSKLQICAARRIEKGSLLSPNEGEVSILLVQDVPPIDNDDIRFIFGCFDRIINDDPKSEDGDNGGSGCDSPICNQIRLCNWIRFLKHSPGLKEGHDPEVNCVAKFVDRQAVFEFTRKVLPGEEIIANFDIKSITGTNIIPACSSVSHSISESVPLDLSKSPEAAFRTNSRSPESASDSNDSSSPKTAPVNMFPFSISSVLQPSKIFQPYSQLIPSRPHRNAPSMSASSSNFLSISSMTGNVRPMSSLNFQPTPSVRPILRTRGRERSLLPCEVCGKAFDRPSLLKRHMRTHTGEKPHICDVCSKGFSTSSSLNTHRRIHSGEKPHQCPICGKRFTASSNLYYHRMTHNKEKPHKCLLCGKSFPTPGDLKSHQYVHSGSWPYNCPVCHRGFSKQTNLRNHLLLHSGDKPHTCQVCGKKFALACNLRAHVRTHEEEPVSSCVSCKRTFLSSLNMLDNGQCRTCIIHQQQNSSSGGSSGGTTSNAAIFPPVNNPLNAGLNGTNGVDTKSSQSLALSVSKLTGVPATVPPLAAPFSAASSAVLNESILAGFSHGLPSSTTGYIGDTMNLLRPNPFLEQLFQWNWRFAKETAGNLGLMQQKLLESQMLAAQLMSVSQNSGVGGADILKFRL